MRKFRVCLEFRRGMNSEFVECNLLLPAKFVCPVDLKKDPQMNAYIIDMGWNVYRCLQEYGVVSDKAGERKGDVTRASEESARKVYTEELERMREFYLGMLKK